MASLDAAISPRHSSGICQSRGGSLRAMALTNTRPFIRSETAYIEDLRVPSPRPTASLTVSVTAILVDQHNGSRSPGSMAR